MNSTEKQNKRIQVRKRGIPPFSSQQIEALEGKEIMTYELFVECLEVCVRIDSMIKYFEIWEKYPEYAEKYKRQFLCNYSKDMAQKSWERFKTMMREEFGEDYI